MDIKEGVIPTALGTAVTAAGIAWDAMAMRKSHNSKGNIMPMVAAGVVGFGIAHVLLGSIDLTQHHRRRFL
jgi:hypothetical protein